MKLTYLNTASIATLLLFAGAAHAETFNIPSGDLKSALDAYARQTGVNLIVAGAEVSGVQTRGAQGDFSTDGALSRLLSGTGFSMHRRSSGAIGIMRDQSSSIEPVDPTPIQIAQATSPRASVETVTVTSSKLGGADVQSIPIAITALSQEQLNAQKIEGGPDLLKSIPNMSFTKTNFTGYSIQIRGIGTQAVSVTTDPAVAVAFNETPFIRNHFFEQEFFDVQNVEVLRGPQGTLYGRNATAGVVNIESAKPTDQFEGEIKAEVGNYGSKRMRGFLNLPIYDDKIDARLAGSWTMRNGFAYNAGTDNRVDGRNLWSTRATIGLNPMASLHADLIWERFEENDNRARSTKQLCKHDPGPDSVDGVEIHTVIAHAALSQGCMPGSLYSPDAFGTPNGLTEPFVYYAAAGGYNTIGAGLGSVAPGDGYAIPIVQPVDPYGGAMQSPNLRVISSAIDPKYRAKSDLFEANASYHITPSLLLTSQTGFNKDFLYSTEDYNRFNTVPVFNNSTGLYSLLPNYTTGEFDQLAPDVTPGGVFCDPQLGCSKSIVGMDISQEHSQQISQELRLSSNFEGPLNFGIGANYTRYRTVEDYYVLYNVLTLIAENTGLAGAFNGSADPTKCIPRRMLFGVPFSANVGQPLVSLDDPAAVGCIYIDPNPLGEINGDGHNYFRSKNPYTLHSWAGFGEAYYQALPDLKFTAGLRYTADNKTFTPVPSQVLLSTDPFTGGAVDRGYPSLPDIKQHWGEFTGRFVTEWSPKVDFTDQSMFYASFSHGYKGGGANPPGIGFSTEPVPIFNLIVAQTLPYPLLFKPEFVNAYETGTKNTLLDGALVLNGDVFFYDYKNYQISQIKSRTAVNENFNATVKGAELEASYEPIPGLRFNLASGYEATRVGDGQKSIDEMDITAGDPNWMAVRPVIPLPDGCIVPTALVAQIIASNHIYHPIDDPIAGVYGEGEGLSNQCQGSIFSSTNQASTWPNGGAGIAKDLSGHELPNSPHFTLSFGAQYGMPINEDWAGLVRADFYLQSGSWARIYNDDPYDRLHGYTNLNLTLDIIKSDGLQFEAYVKNVFNTTAITGAFLNSSDTGLTTNVFVTDPQLIGFSITKSF